MILVYAITPTGQQIITQVSSSQPRANNIAAYSSDGQIVVPIVPIKTDNATSKKYVDDAIQKAIGNVLNGEF